MNEKRIKIAGRSIDLLGLGTWNLNGRNCIRTVASALNMGYRHLDTAQMYGNEDEVGKGINESGVDREEVFVTTKVSTSNLDPDSIRSSTGKSLEKLGTIDLLLIHWPTPRMDLEACLAAMFRLRDEGQIRDVGVSNFNPELFRRSLDLGEVICNQVEFSPYQHQDGNLEVAKDAGIMITAYSPLAKGKAGRDHTLKEIGEKHGKSAAQVALRWLLQQGNVSVIPKASSEKHLEENMGIFDFELNGEELEKVSSLA